MKQNALVSIAISFQFQYLYRCFCLSTDCYSFNKFRQQLSVLRLFTRAKPQAFLAFFAGSGFSFSSSTHKTNTLFFSYHTNGPFWKSYCGHEKCLILYSCLRSENTIDYSMWCELHMSTIFIRKLHLQRKTEQTNWYSNSIPDCTLVCPLHVCGGHSSAQTKIVAIAEIVRPPSGTHLCITQICRVSAQFALSRRLTNGRIVWPPTLAELSLCLIGVHSRSTFVNGFCFQTCPKIVPNVWKSDWEARWTYR